jgi:hypothetical protein
MLYDYTCGRCGYLFFLMGPLAGRPAPRGCPRCSRSRITLNNVAIKDFDAAGISMGPGLTVQASGLELRGNQVGIHNRGGEFIGPDTIIE